MRPSLHSSKSYQAYCNSTVERAKSITSGKSSGERGSVGRVDCESKAVINFPPPHELDEIGMKKMENDPTPNEPLLNKMPRKAESPQRWIILTLSCVMLLGSYYCFDTPSALKSQIHDYMGDEDFETQFALMYTLYAAPNAIIPLFGGGLVDLVGVSPSLLACTILLNLGQIIVAIGFTSRSWGIILLGRFVFALGGENLIVASSALLADWFIGAELAFAFGVNLSIARIGGVVNNVLSPYITANIGILFAMWIGAVVCAASVVAVILAWPIDYNFDNKIAAYSAGRGSKLSVENLHTIADKGDPNYGSTGGENDIETSRGKSQGHADTSMSIMDSNATTDVAEASAGCGKYLTWRWWKEWWNDNPAKLTFAFWLLTAICLIIYSAVLPFNNVASTLLLERDYFKAPPADCPLHYDGQCQSDMNTPNCTLADKTAPPLPVDVTVGGTYYSVVHNYDVDCTSGLWTDPAVGQTNAGCASAYCGALEQAEGVVAYVMSIPYTLSAVLSPFIGFIVDRYGQRATITAISAGCIVAVHCLLGLTDVPPSGPLFGQGIAYTCFAAVLWPAIPIVVELERQGLAFGIATAAYNTGCGVVPLIVATIYQQSGYHYIPKVEYLFIALGVLATVLGLWLCYVDQRDLGGILNAGLSNTPSEEGEEEKDSKKEEGGASIAAAGAGAGYMAVPIEEKK